MAKETDTPQAAETPDKPAGDPGAAQRTAGRTAQQQQVQVDDNNVIAAYANFCRVTGSPEELIIDFGLNPQPNVVPKNPIAVSQRVIVNFYTAKRLLAALQMSVQHHEQIFGVLETDVQKRLRPQVQQQQRQQAGGK